MSRSWNCKHPQGTTGHLFTRITLAIQFPTLLTSAGQLELFEIHLNGGRQHTHHWSKWRTWQHLCFNTSQLPPFYKSSWHICRSQPLHSLQPKRDSWDQRQAPSRTYKVLSMDFSSSDTIRSTTKSLNRRISTGEISPITALILNATVQKNDTKVSIPTPTPRISKPYLLIQERRAALPWQRKHCMLPGFFKKHNTCHSECRGFNTTKWSFKND